MKVRAIFSLLLSVWAAMIRYHIVTTLIVYGVWISRLGKVLVYWKEFVLFALLVRWVWLTRSEWRVHLRRSNPLTIWIWLCVLFLVYAWVDTFIRWSWTELIIPWIKYDLLPILYVMLSVILGVWLTSYKVQVWKSRRQYLPIAVITVVVVGVVRQLWKTLSPELFQAFGYWAIGDYIVWANPPLWYRTWPWWRPRFQWVFAWPNNLGYFLAVVIPVLLGWFLKSRHESTYISWALLWAIIACMLTLSRWALLWSIVWVLLVLCFAYRTWVVSKRMIQLIAWGVLTSILGVWLLFMIKWWSTSAHLAALHETMQVVASSPMGYWIWASGPSIHHAWIYLPENQFLQIFVDLGWFWGILYLLIVIGGGVAMVYTARTTDNYQLWVHIAWISALVILGLFLHSFEDSMVWFIVLVPLLVVVGTMLSKHQTQQLEPHEETWGMVEL